MVTLTPNEVGLCIANYDWGPGGNAKQVTKFLDTAIAIAIAESGLNTLARSDTDDWGVWQINRRYHPEYFSEILMILNPFYNTGAAKEIYRQAGSKFTPWSTYKNGAYRSHLGHGVSVYRYLQSLDTDSFATAKTALLEKADVTQQFNELKGSGSAWEAFLNDPGDALSQGYDDIPDFLKPFGGINPLDAAKSVPDAINAFTDKLLQGAKVAGFFVLAAIVLIVGVLFLLKDTSIGKSAMGALNPAEKATTAAKILS